MRLVILVLLLSLSGLSVNSTFIDLNLCGDEIGDSGTASLSLSLSLSLSPSQALSVNAKLTDLNLDCNQIGQFGVTSLFHALSANTSLAHLISNGKDTGPAGYCFSLTTLLLNILSTVLRIDGALMSVIGFA